MVISVDFTIGSLRQGGKPWSAANCSTTRKPTLWRVRA
jgi:hypothetical protein